jgi:predicted kinase
MLFVVLVGIPCSGKSTSAKKDFEGYTVIERDSFMLKVAGTENYDEAWNIFPSGKQSKVDGEFFNAIREAVRDKKDIVLDRTNVSLERRAEMLAMAPDGYYKVAVFYSATPQECIDRNYKRRSTDGKFVPEHVIYDMYERLVVPSTSEGFDQVITYAENKN